MDFVTTFLGEKTEVLFKMFIDKHKLMHIYYIPLSPSVSHSDFESNSFTLNLKILVNEL